MTENAQLARPSEAGPQTTEMPEAETHKRLGRGACFLGYWRFSTSSLLRND